MQEEEDNIQPVGRKHLPIEVHKQIVRKVSPSQTLLYVQSDPPDDLPARCFILHIWQYSLACMAVLSPVVV